MAADPGLPDCVTALAAYASQAQLNVLAAFLLAAKRKLEMVTQLMAPAGLVIFVVVMAPIILFTDAKNSDVLKTATALVSVELAIVTFAMYRVPGIDKSSVDDIVGRKTTTAQFGAMKKYVGEPAKVQRNLTLLAALAVFVFAMLGLFVLTDPATPK